MKYDKILLIALAMKFCVSLLAILSICNFNIAWAMDSASYSIDWDSINSGGDDYSSSTNYYLSDTVGDQATGISSSTNYAISAGYRYGVSEPTILSFEIGTQENSTKTGYTAFDNAGNTINVTSTTFLSEGNFIAVVENQGLSQVVAVGKIVSIAGLVVTVDQWDGSPAGIGATPAGSDDYVYRLEGNSVEFGTLSTTVGTTSLTFSNVTCNTPNGYTVKVYADGNLLSGANSIANVSDGTVTAAAEEYGAHVYGTAATSTSGDFAFSTATTDIQINSSYATKDRIALVYKVAISASTVGGSYTQTIYYTVTPNF